MAVAEPIVEVPTVTIDPPRGAIGFDLKPLWEYRQLLFFFTWRDLKVRYKQTVLGAKLGDPATAARDHRLHDLLRAGRAPPVRRHSVSGLLLFRNAALDVLLERDHGRFE